MTEPHDQDLLELATPYALHAVSQDEAVDIEQRVAVSPPDVANAFADEVRAVRETMALVASATAAEPPPALRERILAEAATDNVRELPATRTRWRTVLISAAAAVIVALAGIGAVIALRPDTAPSTTALVLAAPDARTVSGDIPTGGTATLTFSREQNAGVLVMNDVHPPSPGTVYQMWLLHDGQAESAGTMDDKAVTPQTTAVLPRLGSSTTLAFTVEPTGGSAQPTAKPFAQLPLI